MIHYILLNTFIYGVLAAALHACLTHTKYINIYLGTVLMWTAYAYAHLLVHGIQRQTIIVTICIYVWLFLIHHIIISYFPIISQRELFALLFTLGADIIWGNILYLTYWPTLITAPWLNLSSLTLGGLLGGIALIHRYFFNKTLFGLKYQALASHAIVLRSIWYRYKNMLLQLMVWIVTFTGMMGIFLVHNQALRASDSFFYLLKALGIAILVWQGKSWYIFVWTLLYVVIEYALFVWLGLPLGYKQALILLIILLVLLLKPQGLFSNIQRQN